VDVADIFISYSQKQSQPTRELAIYLQLLGYSVWWDTNVIPGDQFRAVIDRELDAAKAVIVIWTNESVASEWVISEAQHGHRERKLIPLRTRDLTKQIPKPFDILHTGLVHDRDAILKAVRSHVGDAVFGPKPQAGAVWRLWSVEAVRLGIVLGIVVLWFLIPTMLRTMLRELSPPLSAPEPARPVPIPPEPARPVPIPPAPEPPVRYPVRTSPVIPTPAPFQTIRDCSDCPEMVVVPAGKFMMGSVEGNDNEKPIHEVTISRPFAVGKYEVTFAEWDACVAGGGCRGNPRPDDKGWGRGRRPVIYVHWNDAHEYVSWLSHKTRHNYRLLTEAEWEYAARAGTTTQYAFGDTITKQQAQFGQPQDKGKTVEVGSFPPNAWGLHDMHGNVWEYVEDDYHLDYTGNPPTDSSSWGTDRMELRVLRGGSWIDDPRSLHSVMAYLRYRRLPDRP
jgi:formylglycine-generating enzyme required for sulfatase activity